MTSTSKRSYDIHNKLKYGAMSSLNAKDMEISQDMHVKMSKKIAQLTKVNIYFN